MTPTLSRAQLLIAQLLREYGPEVTARIILWHRATTPKSEAPTDNFAEKTVLCIRKTAEGWDK